MDDPAAADALGGPCSGDCFHRSATRNPAAQLHHQQLLLTALAAAAYGTYVVFGTDIKCKGNDDVIWDPAKEVTVLVCLTWGFQVVSL